MSGTFLVTQKHAADMTGQHLRRETRYGIAFMNQRRDAKFCRLMQHRIADIAAGPEHGIGPEFLQDPARLMTCIDHIFQRVQIMADVFQMVPAAQIGHLQRQNAEAFARNQIHFHFPFGAEEEYFAVRQLFLQALGNRDCRVDVACSPAAGENKFHFTILKKDGSAIRGLPRRAKHR